MKFKNWFLVEDLNTQKEKYTKQGIAPDIVVKYLADFRVIKDKKYKQINDPIHGLENIKNRADIDQYKDFHQLETLVDYVKGQVDVGGRVSYKNLNFSGKPIHEDQDIQIFYADSPRACVEYKGNAPYGWCIARNDSSNLFYAYRYKYHQPAFYFVKNKEKTNTEFGLMQGIKNVVNTVAHQTSKFKDKYHFFVIQVVKNVNPNNHTQKQYVVTSAENDGDKEMSWEEIVKIEPHLQGKEEIFQPKPLTKEESEFYKKYKNGISDEEFVKLPYDQKDMFMNIYINLDKGLSDKQYESLPEDLKNKYIGFGVGLTDEQYSITSDKLKKRYLDVTIKKIETLIEQNELAARKLKNSEIEILKNNIHKFDISKLSDSDVNYLFSYATDKQEMIKLLGQDNISKLSDNNVGDLLLHTTDKQEIAKLTMIIIKRIKALQREDDVGSYFRYATDKQEMIKLIIQNKKELTGNNVSDLLLHATDKQETIKLLGQDNISKLRNELSRTVLIHAAARDAGRFVEMIKLIIQINKELSSENVSSILWYTDKLLRHTDKQEMIKLLGQDNISKLSSDNVHYLLNSAKYKQEMKQILIDNGVKISMESKYR